MCYQCILNNSYKLVNNCDENIVNVDAICYLIKEEKVKEEAKVEKALINIIVVLFVQKVENF